MEITSLPTVQYPSHDRILQNRILRHFHFLVSNAERGIYPIEVRIPKEEFDLLSIPEKEFVENLIKKHYQVQFKWI